VPNAFRSLIESKYGRELFLTSVTGDCVRIYPMPVWLELEEKLVRVPSINPSRQRYLDRVNYYGSPGELDVQGRVLIPVRLREAATMTGEVDVLGLVDHFDVWNHERFVARMQQDPFTDEDARRLSEFGI
jgi:MraZ protein